MTTYLMKIKYKLFTPKIISNVMNIFTDSFLLIRTNFIDNMFLLRKEFFQM